MVRGRSRWFVLVAAGGLAAALLGGSGADARGAPGERSAQVPQPRIVFSLPAATEQTRLHSAIIARNATIGLTHEARIRSATFFVDELPGSKPSKPYAVDRSAPFVVPRRGAAGKHPYGLGVHTLKADVELNSGRHIRLTAPYWVASMIEVTQPSDADTLLKSISSMPAGPVLVRPPEGQTSFEVSGQLELNRPFVVIDGAHVSGLVEFQPGASDNRFLRSTALGFNVFGADNVLIQGNRFDGQGRVSSNQLWDKPAGNTPDGFVIRNNLFQNYFIANDSSAHAEAIFVGYSSGGLIEGNKFSNNGTTSQIFFSWWGTAGYEGADPATTYPRNMCVRGNTFGETHGAYWDVNFRPEIPSNANIKVQRDASNTNPEFYGAC